MNPVQVVFDFLQTELGVTIVGIAAATVGFFVGRFFKNRDERAAELDRDLRAEKQRHFDLLEQFAVKARLAFGQLAMFYIFRQKAIAANREGASEELLTVINDLAHETRTDANERISELRQTLDEIRVRARELAPEASKVLNTLVAEREKTYQSNLTYNMAEIEVRSMNEYEAALTRHKPQPAKK